MGFQAGGMGRPSLATSCHQGSLLGGRSLAFRLRWQVDTLLPVEGGFSHKQVACPFFPPGGLEFRE